MLALAIQCLVIQPHIDVFGSTSVEAAHIQTVQTGSDQSQAVCVICQAMATAGAFALSASPTLGIVERNFLASAAVYYSEPLQRARSHNWQSRAPPQAI
jgi:hypothetical protein